MKTRHGKLRISLGWAILLIFVFSGVAGMAVNFSDNIHYNNLLNRDNGRLIISRTEQAKEQYDIKFLVNNLNSQINCYDLRSNFSKNICGSHDSSRTNNT